MSRAVLVCAASALVLGLAAGQAVAQDPVSDAAIGDTIQGSLDEGDWEDPDGYVADAYRFRVPAGARVEAIMRAEAFDTYLVAGRYGPDGAWEEIGRDDDGLGEGLNSRLRFTAPEEGEYVIRARSFGGEPGGAYELTLGEAPGQAGPASGSLAMGSTVSGTLQAGDAEDDDGVRYDAYRFTAAAGDRLQVTARSDAFDTVVEIGRESRYGQWEPLAWDDDGLGEGLNSQLNFNPDESGEYVIRLRSFSEGNGDYTLALVDRGPLPPPPPPTPLTLGEAVQGALAEGDGVTDDEVMFDQYVVSARRGQRLGVAMDSEAFDTLVQVGRLGPDGAFEELDSNDDGLGAGLNSRLLFTPEQAGDYVIRATAYGYGGVGDYEISVTDLGREPRAETLRPGRAVRGALADRDAVTFSGARYDLYRFRAEAGDRLRLDATSEAFDTVLQVLQADGDGGHMIVAEDDDGAGDGSTDSRLTFLPQEDGEYFLWVKAFEADGRGDYELTMTDLGPTPEPQPLVLGATVTGELTDRDGVAGDASFYDSYRFTGVAGQRLRFVLRSGDFDAFLLLGREGEYGIEGLAEDDDGLGEGTDSRLTFTVPEDGEYVVWANSYGPGETGAYAFEATDLGPAPEPGSLVVGATVRGELGGDDPTDPNGAFYDAYRFQAREGDRLRLGMTSNDFDTYLEFGRRDEGGRFDLIDSNDDFSDLNSRLDATIPATGEYLVRARSYGAGATGEYVLTVEHAPAEETPAETEASDDDVQAAPDAEGEAPAE